MAGSLCRMALACVSPKYNTIYIVRGFKNWLAPTLDIMSRKKKEIGPQPFIHRSLMLEWNYYAELFAFSKRLGEYFDSNLLQQALTTQQYMITEIDNQKAVGIEQPEFDIKHNKQMIKDGDRIISHYILRYIRAVIPRLPEEGVCALHDYLTSDSVLATVGFNIGLADLILTTDIPPEDPVVADAVKAMISALAECSGLDRATLLVRDLIITHLVGKHIFDIWHLENPVELAADILKRDGRYKVEVRLIGNVGRHTILSAYQVGLFIDKEYICYGYGEDLKVAKEMAALNFLAELFNINETMKPLRFDAILSPYSSKALPNLSLQDWCQKNFNQLQINY